jgi:glycosyltransferase involved in cell wall biosynthesis
MLMSVKLHHAQLGIMNSQSRQDTISKLLLWRIQSLQSLKHITYIDELFSIYIQKTSWLNHRKYVFTYDAPSLMETDRNPQAARLKLGIKQGQFVILVYGQLSKRKGIAHLLSAVSGLKNNQQIVVMLAGQQDEDVKGWLRDPDIKMLHDQSQIIELDRFLDDEDERTVFSAADVVWLGYEDFGGMSGVLVNAAKFGLPVIACETGMIGWTTRQYGLGKTVSVQNRQQVMDAITALQQGNIRDEFSQNAKRMADKHDGAAFGEAICNLFENRSHS